MALRTEPARRYGAEPYDPTARHAKALLADIREHLGEAPFVTRDDLLFLPWCAGWATITRYTYVRLAVRWLVDHGELIEKTKTELCLAGQESRYAIELGLAEKYAATIRRIVLAQRQAFTLMDVVNAWQKQDQHLTTNGKRAAVRGALRALHREELITQHEDGYRWVKVTRWIKQAKEAGRENDHAN